MKIKINGAKDGIPTHSVVISDCEKVEIKAVYFTKEAAIKKWAEIVKQFSDSGDVFEIIKEHCYARLKDGRHIEILDAKAYKDITSNK